MCNGFIKGEGYIIGRGGVNKSVNVLDVCDLLLLRIFLSIRSFTRILNLDANESHL